MAEKLINQRPNWERRKMMDADVCSSNAYGKALYCFMAEQIAKKGQTKICEWWSRDRAGRDKLRAEAICSWLLFPICKWIFHKSLSAWSPRHLHLDSKGSHWAAIWSSMISIESTKVSESDPGLGAASSAQSLRFENPLKASSTEQEPRQKLLLILMNPSRWIASSDGSKRSNAMSMKPLNSFQCHCFHIQRELMITGSWYELQMTLGHAWCSICNMCSSGAHDLSL